MTASSATSMTTSQRSQCLCRTGHRDSVAARSDLGRWRLLASTGRRHRGRHAGRTRARVDDSNTASGSLVAVPRDRRRFLYCQSSEAVPPRFVSMLNDTPQCAWLTTHRWLMTVVQPLRVVLGHRVLTARLSLCRFYEVLVLVRRIRFVSEVLLTCQRQVVVTVHKTARSSGRVYRLVWAHIVRLRLHSEAQSMGGSTALAAWRC